MKEEIISKEDLQQRIQFLANIINKEEFNLKRSVVFVGVFEMGLLCFFLI
jgi:hypoxanthine-guanine phosphoribosyltransferase